MKELTKLAIMLGLFGFAYFLPVDHPRLASALYESLALVKWYAREHVLLCLVPAFFIAGAIGVFVSQGAVMKYLGPRVRWIISYPVAAMSGGILAVCSCTVLPLFAGIHKRGAGLGPATAFLYSGPAINVLAIILTARVLGLKLGIARAIGAVVFAVVIGGLMAFIFRKEEQESTDAAAGFVVPAAAAARRPWQEFLYFAAMVGILVFANWGRPAAGVTGVWAAIYGAKWIVTGFFAVVLAGALFAWFDRDELLDWVDATWGFTKQIMPLLLAGVAAAGLLLGGPHSSDAGLIPNAYVASLVGGDGVAANFFAAIVGAFMYFATLTEVPILEGLLKAGMGQGPALSLLLAGPALSLPNMLVIRSVLGTRKTVVYISLVVVFSALAGIIFGGLFG